jgi:hypothetical protein
VGDSRFIKKGVYGAKIFNNYIVGSYELLQDVLLTADRYKSLNIISDFRIVNHMIEARKAGVKVITQLDSNSAVTRFGAKFRKEDGQNKIKPIWRRIESRSYFILFKLI